MPPVDELTPATPGMLNDDDAFTVYQALKSETDQARGQVMADALGRYVSDRRSRNLPLFQPNPEVQRKRQERFDGLYAGLDTAETHLEPEAQTQLNGLLRMSVNPEESKARMINSAYIRSEFPDTDPVLIQDNWDLVKVRYAKEQLGLDRPDISDRELYGAIGGKLKKRQAETQMLTAVSGKMVQAAMSGEAGWLDAWKQAADGISQNEGWDPARHDLYRDSARKVFERVQEQIAPNRALIEAGRNYYERAVKEGPTEEVEALRDQFMDGLLALPADQRDFAFQVSVLSAQKRAPARRGAGGEAGLAEKAAVALERGIGDIPAKAAAFTKQATMTGVSAFARLRGESVVIENVEQERDRMKVSQMIEEGLKATVDPVRANGIVQQMVLGTVESLPYMASVATGYGVPVAIAAMAEDARQQLEENGVAPNEAVGLGLLAGGIQAGLERIPAKMVFRGALPFEKAMGKWLNAPVLTKGAFAKRLAAAGGINLLTQNFEELAQDLTTPLVQEVGSWLSDSIPDVKWTGDGGQLEQIAGGRMETFWSLLPMVMLGTGSATFKDAAFGRQYLNNLGVLKASGFTDEAARQILDAPTVEEKQALVRGAWNDERLRVMNSEAQRAAFDEIDASLQQSYLEEARDTIATVRRQPDGSWAVLDQAGEVIDVAQTPETALEVARAARESEDVQLETAIESMIGYFRGIAEPGAVIERVRERRTLKQAVEAGDITELEAKDAIRTAIELGSLEKGTRLEDIERRGENVGRYNAKAGIFEDVSRIFEGATPLTVVEEHAEGYIKRRLDAGDITLESIAKWRDQLEGERPQEFRETPEGPVATLNARELIEWFSQQAQGYMVGNIDAAQIPNVFRSFLRRLKEYFAKVLQLGAKLRAMEQAGTLPEDFRTHLARAVGLDEAFLESKLREQERAAAGEKKESIVALGAKKLGQEFLNRVAEARSALSIPRAEQLTSEQLLTIADAERRAEKLKDLEEVFLLKKPDESLRESRSEYEKLVARLRADEERLTPLLERLEVESRPLFGITAKLSPQAQRIFEEEGFGDDPTFALALRGEIDEAFRQRRVAERIEKGEQRGEAFSSELREAMGEAEYEVKPDQVRDTAVGRYLADKGVDGALDGFMSDVTEGLTEDEWVVLGTSLVRTLDKAKRYADAQRAAFKLAERGTSAGRTLRAFSTLGQTVDSTEKALVLHAKENQKKADKIKKATPAIDAVREELAEVIEEQQEKKRRRRRPPAKPRRAEAEEEAETAVEIEEAPGIEITEQDANQIMDTVIGRLRVKGIDTPTPVRETIKETLVSKQPTADAYVKHFRKLLGTKFDVRPLSDKDVVRLGDLAANIKSTPENSQERMEAVIELNSFVMDRVQPYDWVDVTFGLWYSSVLSGIPTTLRNILGNTSFMMANAGLGFLQQRPRDWLRSWRQLGAAIVEGREGSVDQFAAILLGRRGARPAVAAADEKARKSVLETSNIKGPWKAGKFVGRFLAAQDSFFFTTAYELQSRQAALEMARQMVTEGTLSEEQMTAEIERMLNATTDQIQKFRSRATGEWDQLTQELQAKTKRDTWIDARALELRRMERSDSLVARAVDAAQRSTFAYAPEGILGVLVTSVDRGISAIARSDTSSKSAKFAGQFMKTSLLPFVRVPVNVFNQALDYSPAGLARAIIYGTYGKKLTTAGGVGTVEVSPQERAAVLHRAVLGTAAMLILGMVARPRPDEPEEEQPWLQIHGRGSGNSNKDRSRNGPNWQPWSIEIRSEGQKRFINYRLLPIAPMLAMLGFVHDRERYGKDAKGSVAAFSLAQGMAAAFLAQSPMTSLADLAETSTLEKAQSEASIQRTLARSTTGFAVNVAVPLANFWRSVDRMFVLDEKTAQVTVKAAALAQVPFGEHFNQPRLDALGDAIENRAWDWAMTAYDEGVPEARIYRAFASKEIQPSDPYSYKHKMEPAMYYAFTRERGQFIKSELLANGGRLLSRLESADNEEAQAILRDITREANRYAKDRVGYKAPLPPEDTE